MPHDELLNRPCGGRFGDIVESIGNTPLVDLPPGCSFNPRCPFAFERCVRETPLLQPVGPQRRAACHLYPQHAELPPMPARTLEAHP